MAKSKLKNKEKGFDGTGNLPKILFINDTEIFKSFGVQSRVGEIGNRTDLISQKSAQDFVGSSFLTKIPHPAHLS